MASSSGSDTTSILLDRYRVEATLGEGSFGTVVRAFDTRLKRVVAIKTLKRSLATADIGQFRAIEERFAREAEAGSRMGIHMNLVTVHDLVIEPDRTQFLILQFVSGGTLAERLARGPLSLGNALGAAAEIARGLQAAHDVGIVHRDVKPANVFLTPDGRAQLGDFGIAQIDDVSGRTHAVVSHPGTPLYMSPEQAQTTGYVRPASDQYSLGLVLFEMLTGQAYKRIGARAATALLESQPAAVINLIEDMVATNPDDRLPSCGHIARQIQTILQQVGQGETQLDVPLDAERDRNTSRPPGVSGDSQGASSGSLSIAPLDTVPTAGGGTDGTRRPADSADDAPPPGTAGLDAGGPPSLPPGIGLAARGPRGGSRRGIAMGIGILLALLLVIGVGAMTLLRSSGTPAQVTQTPQQPAAAAVVAATVATSPTAAPTILPTAPPTTAPQPTTLPSPAATATAAPTATLAQPTVAPTAVRPAAVPASAIAVYSVGTTNANLTTVNGDDVVTAFTVGQEVYGWINFGGAQVNKDVLEATVVANGTPQQPQSFTLTKSDGFQVFSLGKLGAGDYRLEVRYAGKIAQTADFHITPPVAPRQATPVPRATAGGGGSTYPTTAPQPTATSAPVYTQPAPTTAPTVAPKPTVYVPPTQPPPKP